MTKDKPHRRSKQRQAATNMRDVARMAGVSAQTVSRYFKNPQLLGTQNRQRVAQVVAETGYVLNPAASSLSANRTNFVAVIVPTIDHSIFSEIISGLASELEAENHGLLIADNAYSLDKEERLVERFLAYKVAGIVLVGQLHSDRTRRLLQASATPTIELLETDGMPIDTAIGFSNFAASYELTSQLIALGRRRIGFISALPRGNDRVQRRLDGYRAALRNAGLLVDDRLIAHTPFKIEDGARAFAQIKRDCPDIDAVVSNDILGVGIQLQCARQGLGVPDDIAITGFDDLEVAAILDRRLTTVKMDSHRMGLMAAKVIVKRRIQPAEIGAVLDIGYEILWRDTTP